MYDIESALRRRAMLDRLEGLADAEGASGSSAGSSPSGGNWPTRGPSFSGAPLDTTPVASAPTTATSVATTGTVGATAPADSEYAPPVLDLYEGADFSGYDPAELGEYDPPDSNGYITTPAVGQIPGEQAHQATVAFSLASPMSPTSSVPTAPLPPAAPPANPVAPAVSVPPSIPAPVTSPPEVTAQPETAVRPETTSPDHSVVGATIPMITTMRPPTPAERTALEAIREFQLTGRISIAEAPEEVDDEPLEGSLSSGPAAVDEIPATVDVAALETDTEAAEAADVTSVAEAEQDDPPDQDTDASPAVAIADLLRHGADSLFFTQTRGGTSTSG